MGKCYKSIHVKIPAHCRAGGFFEKTTTITATSLFPLSPRLSQSPTLAANADHHQPLTFAAPMDALRRRRTPSSDRILGLLSPPAPSSSSSPSSSGYELDEVDLFFPSPTNHPPSPSHRRLLPDEPSGILAALPEVAAARRAALLRNPNLSPSRPIPAAAPRPRGAAERVSFSVPSGRQSAPMAVPAAAAGGRGRSEEEEEREEVEGGMLLPPHEIIARASSPMTASSVLEGKGRTLKGRDLRRVRNAVWRQTGFLD